MKNNEKLIKFCKNNGPLLGFFVLEVLALTAFNLANVANLFRIVAFLLVLALLPFGFVFFKKEDIKSLIILLVPICVYAITMAFSNFAFFSYNIVTQVGIALGLIAFFVLGVLARKISSLKAETVILVLGCALGLLVFISLGYTLIRYGFFHSLIYKDLYYYYEGETYPVFSEAKFLFGFNFEETKLTYVSMFGVILTNGIYGLLFINYKDNKKGFLICLSLGLLGLLSLILVPNLWALLLLLPSLVLALLIRFYPKKILWQKTLRIIFYSFISIFSLLVLVFIINATQFTFISEPIKNNAFLNRCFNTSGFSKPFADAIFIMTRKEFLFGVTQDSLNSFNAAHGTILNIPLTGSFVFDACYEGGVFAFIAVATISVISFISLINYFKKSDDQMFVKIIILSFILSLFIYTNLTYEELPLAHNNYYFSFVNETLILIMLFLIGYTFTSFFNTKNNIETNELNGEQNYEK